VNLDELSLNTFIVQPDSDELVLSKEKEKILRAAAGKLTEREQKLFGFLQEGLSVEEIGLRDEKDFDKKTPKDYQRGVKI
jgi:hypothetical protein